MLLANELLLLLDDWELDLRRSLDLPRPGVIMAAIFPRVFGEKLRIMVFAHPFISSGFWVLNTFFVGVRPRFWEF